jgi:hypothetical protein
LVKTTVLPSLLSSKPTVAGERSVGVGGVPAGAPAPTIAEDSAFINRPDSWPTEKSPFSVAVLSLLLLVARRTSFRDALTASTSDCILAAMASGSEDTLRVMAVVASTLLTVNVAPGMTASNVLVAEETL